MVWVGVVEVEVGADMFVLYVEMEGAVVLEVYDGCLFEGLHCILLA